MMLSLALGLSLSLLAAAPPTVSKPPPVAPKTESLTPATMRARTVEMLAQMRSVLSDTLKKLEEARGAKDVVKLNCVNEKLTQVKALLRISEQADVTMQEAIVKREQLAAEHEFTKISIAADKIRLLRAEAEECIGQLAYRTDQNLSVEVEVPNNLPTSDPTVPSTTLPPSSRPPPASPTL